MKSITSLAEFVKQLEENDIQSFPKIIGSLAIPTSEFQKFATWNDHKYTRNCILRTETFELILLCWNQLQETAIHKHGGQKCWVYQIDGAIKECRYQEMDHGRLKKTQTINLQPGTVTYMEDYMGFHTLHNVTNTKAMSLHIYASPITSCEVFCDDQQKFVTKDLIYDSK